MSKTRRNHGSAFKAKVALEALKGEQTVAEIAAKHGLHPTLVTEWKRQLADGASAVFDKGTGKAKDTVSVADREALRKAAESWIGKKKARDYVAVQAYIDPSVENAAKLQTLRASILQRLNVATTLGFGPRFLHSTGQLHKGGPNSGLVLQIVDQPTDHLAVPETNYTFEALIKAQALGDFSAMKQRRRRVLRVNLGSDAASGLNSLTEVLRAG